MDMLSPVVQTAVFVFFSNALVTTAWPCDCDNYLVECNVYQLSTRLMDSMDRSSPTGNLLVSPYGLWALLLATHKAAHGDTESVLTRALYDQLPSKCDAQKATDRYYREEHPINQQPVDTFWFRMSIIHTRKIKQDYIDQIKNLVWHWRVNFADEDDPLQLIRDYSSDVYTHKTNLMQRSDFTSKTEFVVQTLLKLESKWKVCFDETSKVRHNNTKFYAMMTTTGYFFHAYDKKLKCRYIFLEFQNEDVIMVIAAPEYTAGKATTTWGMLDPDDKELSRLKVHVPKFKYEVEYSLKDVMKDLKSDILFKGGCDVSGATGVKGPASQVVQRTIITIDEDGIKFEAYTVLVVDPSGKPRDEHYDGSDKYLPFMFYLFVNNTIVGQGRVMDPTF